MSQSDPAPSSAEGVSFPPPARPTRAVIFANGELRDPQAALALLRPDDWIIAADGGALHAQALGRRPHVVVGDLDSLPPGSDLALQAQGIAVQAHPIRKDQTDLELAIRHALQAGITDVLVLGALGGRWDQTLANLLLPALADLAAARIRLVDGAQQIYLVGRRTVIEGQPGDTVSLIPLGGDVRGIVTDGLEYPLGGETLALGSTRGISNTLVGQSASVLVEDGQLMCVVIGK